MLTCSKVFASGGTLPKAMDRQRETQVLRAMKAYVMGDSSEPVVLSALRGVTFEDRTHVVTRHRSELEAIDGARLLILESMMLPLSQRHG